MKLQILSVPDCPNVAPLQQRLAAVLAGREDVTVTAEVIDTPEQAIRVGMNGSPTVLVNGIDPFAEPGHAPSVSCRLYRDETGNPTGTPSVAQLRTALNVPGTPPPAVTVAAAALAEQDCCSRPENTADTSAEGLRTRIAPTDPAARAVHQAILRAFATTGEPPTNAALQQIAAANGATADTILTQLHDADVIRLNPARAIGVAYPFSAVPTRHRVQLTTGVEVSAMCAIDALGIPAMLDTDATVISTDPVTHQPVTITVHKRHYAWNPATAVVFYSAAVGTGPSADCCCDDLNTFTSAATAGIWMREHPSIPGELLDPMTAERLGQHIFGALLDRQTFLPRTVGELA
ncbi:alkylmercury lyase family protein [Actinocrispum wychmicini]|uniref:Alkylmercury lyase-like protein n=1 Tax=Actinocrispum wychmicini TaxID=1213861 RepID=A0A4R2JR31_9PSEU|nr:alkylmercury lyase family protein [Actinocrispum wychmicini]TCO59279.1 alkylmercury lyase-like protein [Actinocrispum wychmicini]